MGCSRCGKKTESATKMAGFASDRYSGPCQYQYFYLVGKNTPSERLFAPSDIVGASAFSSENGLSIQAIIGNKLPADAALALCA
jgi:hypothetical protein